MRHGWLCIAACTLFCKAHFYDGAVPSADPKSCTCTVKVPLTDPPPIEITATKQKPKEEPTNEDWP